MNNITGKIGQMVGHLTLYISYPLPIPAPLLSFPHFILIWIDPENYKILISSENKFHPLWLLFPNLHI